MTVLDYLFFLFVEPLRLLFEVIFFYAYKFTSNCGLSIIAMSLVVNILLLPLYFRADKLEKEQNDKKKKMESGVKRIKKSFMGDERIMILQTYYRINDHKSTDVFKESISLFLQIPFFIAAYSFLSGLQMLHGVSLGPIADLGLPDGLVPIGSLHINLLPILMTLINIASGFIYSEKGHFKDKIKLILIALVFLVLLYGSPSGLVFYWTLNNLFSLVKNIVVHYSKPKAKTHKAGARTSKISTAVIMLSLAIIAVMTGLLIPADVISENPQEMVNSYSAAPHSPALYLVTSMLIAAGAFLIWIPLFSFLTKEKTGRILTLAAPAAAIISIVNYILFNKNFGLLSSSLKYETDIVYTFKEIALNALVDIAIAAAVIYLASRFHKAIKLVLAICLVTVCILSITNTYLIVWKIEGHHYYNEFDPEDISVPMTTTGENVVVIMMDRMMGVYIPYIFNERPDVAAQFDGFTLYPETISYGAHTNFASPALFGGYEYTPAELNARDDELLVDKHNEALRVLPTIFAQNDWIVSVGDPPYANYEWIPDVSIYEDNEDINAFLLSGTFNERSDLLAHEGETFETRLNRNLFCYGLMKTMPYFIQPALYASGTYDYIDHYYEGFVENEYIGTSLHTQPGIFAPFIQEYLALDALPEIIDVRDDPQNCFFMFSNCATHELSLLSEPDYTPEANVDNTEYDAAHMDRFTVNGVTMNMEEDYLTYAHYESTMAACIELGQWFDSLRQSGIYDNTRIIIVADHGFNQHQFDDLIMTDPDFNVQEVNPVLMVKDFGSTEFTVSYDFMTNADTPYLALNGVIDNPVNPFTGVPITEFDKSGDHLIFISQIWNVNFNNGTQFQNDPESFWLTFNGNRIEDDDNWAYYYGFDQ